MRGTLRWRDDSASAVYARLARSKAAESAQRPNQLQGGVHAASVLAGILVVLPAQRGNRLESESRGDRLIGEEIESVERVGAMKRRRAGTRGGGIVVVAPSRRGSDAPPRAGSQRFEFENGGGLSVTLSGIQTSVQGLDSGPEPERPSEIGLVAHQGLRAQHVVIEVQGAVLEVVAGGFSLEARGQLPTIGEGARGFDASHPVPEIVPAGGDLADRHAPDAERVEAQPSPACE